MEQKFSPNPQKSNLQVSGEIKDEGILEIQSEDHPIMGDICVRCINVYMIFEVSFQFKLCF